MKPFTTQQAVAQTTDLIFSEYIKGSGSNKAIEIFNGTGNPVDLSEYSLVNFTNGASQNPDDGKNTSTVSLSGTLPAGEVYVVSNSGANQAILDKADLTGNSYFYGFNGDDAIVLFKNYDETTRQGTIVDAIGKIGEDPGTAWTANDVSTADQTLVRKSTVTAGDTNGTDSFDPSIEWDSYAKDDFTHLGTHSVEGTIIEPPTDPGTPGIAPIADVIAGGVGKETIVQGTVTTKPGANGGKSFYIQDSTGGILVYTNTVYSDVVIGATVKVTGSTAEYKGKFQIEPADIEVVDATPSEPAPKVIGIDGLTESVEGQLVKLEGVTVKDLISDDYKNAAITVTNGTIDASAKLDSRTGFDSTTLTATVGDVVNVVGVVEDRETFYQVLLRTPNDMTEAEVTPQDPNVKTIEAARALSVGTEVTVQGVVTHAETATIMYVQDATSGVKIDTFGKNVDLSSFKKGDEVKLTGKVSIFKEETQITVDSSSNITKLGSGKSMPVPATITLDELDAYEGQLVKVEMAKLIDVTSDNYSFLIEDLEKNTTKLYHDKAKNFSKTDYQDGQYYDIIGVSAKYTSPQLKLRDGADMVKKEAPETAKLPIIYNVKPAKMASVLELKPSITGNIEEADTNIDWGSFKLIFDGVDITDQTSIDQGGFKFSYTPAADLALGEHSIAIEVADVAGAKTEYVSYFYVKETIADSEYNFYFGVPHAHTGYSDGKGTPAEAYQMAYDNGLDYLIVSDHSNWLDGDDYITERKEFVEKVGSEWEQTKQQMNEFNSKHSSNFLALRGFEMTSSNWGHINVTNANDYVEAKKTVTELGDFYEWLTTEENVVAAFNHPNWPSDSFNDLAYVPEIDHIMAMLEVGNGAPPYSYARAEENFFRAMDNGWHVGAINGQDNHSANWGTPDNLTAVVAEDLTNESFIEAVKQRRVYSTEARDTKLRVKANGNWMGSTLDVADGSDLNFDIWVQDSDNPIDEIQIITNGGNILKSEKVGGKTEYSWAPTITDGNGANWYVVKVIHSDSKWTTASAIYTSGGENDVKLTLLTVNPDPSVPGSETELTATVSNMGVRAAQNLEVKFYRGSVAEDNYIGTETIPYIGPGKRATAKATWIPTISGQEKIIAVLTDIPGVTTVTKIEKSIKVVKSNGKKVLVDSAHSNADVPGAMNNFMELLRRYGYDAKYNSTPYTAEVLAGYDVLVINAPDKDFTQAEMTAISDWVKAGGSLMAASKSNFGFENTKLNPVLAEMGSGIRINNDNVYEPNTSKDFSGGMKWSVYAKTMPETQSGLNNNLDAIRYFSGSSLVDENLGALTNDQSTGLEILVAGNKTSYNYNVAEGYHTYNEAIGGESDENQTSGPDGDKIPLIAKEYVGEGRIIVAGRHFYSDFEIVNDVSNTSSTLTLMDWLADHQRIQPISKVRETAKDGDIVTVKGVVTAPTGKFFDTVYIQDETGGISLYGSQGRDLPIGTVVIATGGVTYFEGEMELEYENFDMEILYVGPGTEVDPKTVSSDKVTAGTYNGQLVKMTGTIKEINDENSYMIVTDCNGDTYIHTDGYLPLGVDRFQVGEQIDVQGIASSGAAGNRIRVRFAEDLNLNTEVIDCTDPTVPGDEPGNDDDQGDDDQGNDDDQGEDQNGDQPGSNPKEIKPTVKGGKVTVDTAIINGLEKGESLVINLEKEFTFTVQLTSEQIKVLKEKGVNLVIKNNDAELQISASILPDGAVSIQVKRMKDIADAVSAVYDFKVTGNGKVYHLFDKELTLKFKVDSKKVKKSKNVKVLYYNEEKKEWELVGGEYKDGYVVSTTDHLSTYAAFEVTSSDDVKDISAPKDGYKLPNTATKMFSLILLGTLFIAAGLTTFIVQRRKLKQSYKF